MTGRTQRAGWAAGCVAVLLPVLYVGVDAWLRHRAVVLPVSLELVDSILVMSMAIYASVAAAQRLSRWWLGLTALWVLVLGFFIFTGMSWATW